MDYREAGVDIEAGRAFVGDIRSLVESTRRPGVLGGLGGFGGFFELPSGYRQPVLVSGTDGVGTKLKIAHQVGRHDTIGIDLVAMCVNDILTAGAEPLYFLDYLATGRLDREQLTAVVQGIAAGCRESGCALLGGETAEMPGFYGAGEYDVAGFAVGIAGKSELLDGSQVQLGDVAIALASSGVHSNGYSLVRKVVANSGLDWTTPQEFFGGKSLSEVFLTPTRLYVKPVLAAKAAGLPIHGMAHITGGGLPENLPRCLGPNQSVAIDLESWEWPTVFRWLAKQGNIADSEMFNTFNMGVGLVVIVPAAAETQVLKFFKTQGQTAWTLGEVVAGDGTLIGLP